MVEGVSPRVNTTSERNESPEQPGCTVGDPGFTRT